MKKLLLILLCLPMIGFGQYSILDSDVYNQLYNLSHKYEENCYDPESGELLSEKDLSNKDSSEIYFCKAIKINYSEEFNCDQYFLNLNKCIQFTNDSLLKCFSLLRIGEPELENNWGCKTEYNHSIKYYNKALNSANDYPDVKFLIHMQKANFYWSQLSNYREAIDEYSLAQRTQPSKKHFVHAQKAIMFESIGNYEDAMDNWINAIEFCRKFTLDSLDLSDLYFRKGTLEKTLKKYSQARYTLQQSVSYSNENSYQRVKRIKYLIDFLSDYDLINEDFGYKSYGRVDKDEKYKVIIDLCSELTMVTNYYHVSTGFYERGWAYYRLNEYLLAIKDFNRYLTIYPGNKSAYVSISYCYDRLNDKENYKYYLKKACESGHEQSCKRYDYINK